MSRHLTMPVRMAKIVRWAGAGHTEGLDAWLGAECRPDLASGTARARSTIDWSAPSQPVALAYDTATDELADTRLPGNSASSGVRAVVQEGSRRLMFETDAYEIVLRVAANRQTSQYDLAGQVLKGGLPLPGAPVRLEAGGVDSGASRSQPTVSPAKPPVSTDQTSTDLAGGFSLPALMHGAYALHVAVDGAVLTTPTIALD